MYQIGIYGMDQKYQRVLKDAIRCECRKRECIYHICEFEKEKDLLQFYNTNTDAHLDLLFCEITEDNETLKEDLAQIKAQNDYCYIVLWNDKRWDKKKFRGIYNVLYMEKEELIKEIWKIFNNTEKGSELYYQIIKGNGRKKEYIIKQREIIYIEREKRHSYIHIIGREEAIVIPEKLDDIYKNLNRNYFWRCHYSYIVNCRYVDKYLGRSVVMDDGKEIMLSRKFYIGGKWDDSGDIS